MSLGSGSGVKLQARLEFASIQSRSKGGGFLGLLRILLTIAEIGGSLLLPELAPIFVVAGALSQESIDIYEYVSASPETRRSRTGSFILSTLVNILPAAVVVRSEYGASKTVIGIIDRRFSDGVRWVVRGEEGFDDAVRLSKLNPSKYTRITRRAERELIAARQIDPKRIMVVDKFEKALQKEFNHTFTTSGYIGGRYAKEGEFIFSNKDLAIFRRLARRLYYGQATESEIIRGFSKTSLQAEGLLTKNWVWRGALTKEGNELAYKLTEIGSHLQPQSFTQFANRTFAGKWGNRLTQFFQLGNPNDLARELMNKPFNKLTRILKKNIAQWSKSLKLSESRIAKAVEGVEKGLKASTKKFLYINEQLKKHGFVFEDQSFVMGYRVLQALPVSSLVIIYFNPQNTNAKTPGSKNYGGKKEVITTLTNTHLAAWRTRLDPGAFYLKGGGGFPPIAIYPGGKRAFAMEVSTPLMGAFLSSVPLPALRNLLSVASNLKGVGKSVAQGTYSAKWLSTVEDTFQRLLPNKVAKLAGGVLGAPFGKVASGHLQRLALATSKGFQYTRTSSSIVNGHTIKRTSTQFSFNRPGGFNPSQLVKNGIPTSVRSTMLRQIPQSYGGNRQVGAVGSQFKGQRTAQNVRRIPGLFK